MIDQAAMAARIMDAQGDPRALAALSIELLAALAAAEGALEALATADEQRRAKQAKRTRDSRSRHATSRDVTLHDVTVRDVTVPPRPSPSLLPPTPPNNSSSPHTPASSSAAGDEQLAIDPDEQAFHADCDSPAFTAIAHRFLEGKDPTARSAWIGRFRGAMGRPPHPTSAELADALEDLMTRPREDWTPTLFRVYVRRIRADATRDAEQDAERAALRSSDRPRQAASRPVAESGEAGAMFARIRQLIQTTQQPGQRAQRFIPRAAVDALGDRAAAAYDQVGGAQRFLDETEKVGFLLRDFVQAYGTLTAVEVA